MGVGLGLLFTPSFLLSFPGVGGRNGRMRSNTDEEGHTTGKGIWYVVFFSIQVSKQK